MGLLDKITTASGDGGGNYAKKGRHVLELTRVTYRDESSPLGAGFNFDGKVLATNNPDAHTVGDVIRGNCIFSNPKMVENNLARMRRILAAFATSAKGEKVRESEITPKKVLELTGEDQPLVGTIVVVNGSERKGNNGNVYTLYEAEVPGQADLKAAGLTD